MYGVIDIHSHFNHGVEGDTPVGELYRADLPFLKKQYARLGIEKVALCSFASVCNVGAVVAENEYLRALCRGEKTLYQWVVVDPRQKQTFAQADEYLTDEKCLGIKLHSPYHGYDILEYVDEIFAFANQRRATVLMHPDQILEVAKRTDAFPDMSLIVAHLGSVEHVEAIARAGNGNVYTDTSGIASSKNNILEYAVSRVGSKNILFGTDTYSAAFQLGRVVFADLREDEKQNILSRNAKSLFAGKL